MGGHETEMYSEGECVLCVYVCVCVCVCVCEHVCVCVCAHEAYV